MKPADPTLFFVILSALLTGSCAVQPDHLRSHARPGVAPDPSTLPRATNPAEAFRFRRLSWLDENGQIQPGAYQRALDQRRTNLDFWASSFSTRTAGITPASWTSRGPSNIGGRTRSILIHPTQTNRLWAGSVSGGIWSSTNSGATWSPMNDELPNLAIGCMVMDPANPDVMYAGTGEGQFNGDAIGGIGMYKTINAGATWTLMPGTNWGNIGRIAIHPTNRSIMLAGTRYGGIQRTVNGGTSWSNPIWAQGCFYVAFHPTDGSKAVASLIDYDWGTGEWFYRAIYSTNAGATWTTATGPLSRVNGFGSRVELAYSKSSPNIVYAVCGADGKIYKSTDGGQSYAVQTLTGSTGTSWYCAPLWVDPTNPNILMAGGGGVVRSTDGGVTLTGISCGYINTIDAHPDIHYIVHDPNFNGTTNRRVYVCTDGGVYKAENAYTVTCNTGWTRLEQTYRTTQFYGAAGHGQSGRIYGGTQDNGSLLLNNGSDVASLPFGGDGGFCAIDPTNPNILYGEYITLQIHRSKNGGASAGYITQYLPDAGTAANFIAPFVLDQSAPNRMLAGGNSLWRSDNVDSGFINGQPLWTSIRSPGTSYINGIAIAPGNSDVVWISQNDAKIYKSTNATLPSPTWTTIDDNTTANPLPDRWVGRIVIDRDNSNIVYVALGGFAPDNLWRTTDGGVTWTNISGTPPTALPSAPIRGLARHPSRPQWLYAGTEVGIFASSDGGATWSTTDDGPANVSVDELVFMHGSETLLAATHGRGIFTAPVASCPADFNGDGFVDGIDYDQFNNAFESGEESADFNGDGFVDGIDYDQFNNAFESGC